MPSRPPGYQRVYRHGEGVVPSPRSRFSQGLANSHNAVRDYPAFTIRSIPPMYGRRTSGTVIEPSAF
jgi:hypothetical protein